MQHNIKGLLGYRMGATDGEIGEVKDFYFDDQTWTIRYLVVKTGSWLLGREVLISPGAMLKTSWMSETFPVNLTMEQIRDSPDIDTDKPVSRQQEIELYGHYPWQPYWGSGFYAGGILDPGYTYPVIDEVIVKDADPKDNRSNDDLHLRSTGEVTGYHIHTTDGTIGHVADYIMNDETWQLEYLVVDTHNWLGGKKVLIDVKNIKEVHWENSKVFVDVTAETLKSSSVFGEPGFKYPERTAPFPKAG